MRGTTSYDGNLQMFCEAEHDVDIARLRFMRWLIERDRLEHPAFGAPAGEYADPQGEPVCDDADLQRLLAQAES